MPKVSVVVPMYNVEKYLSTCIDSICGQTLDDIEIILVDDGSPDDCGRIAEAYAARDGRIKVVHQANSGLGPARNTGIENAVGEYVGFVDSDDWIEPSMYQSLYEAAVVADADVAYTGVKTVVHGNVSFVTEHPFSGKTLCGEDEIFSMRRAFYGAAPAKIKEDPTPVSVWLAIYKRSLFEGHGLRFINVRNEDKFFNTHVCRKAQIVTCISGTPYCYRKDDQVSITKTFSPDTIESFFTMYRLLEDMAGEEPAKFRDECMLRARRCIIDYSRVLIRMIENSGASEDERRGYARDVCARPALKEACEGYPFHKLPVMQAIFGLCMKYGYADACRLLLRLKG